MGLFVDDARTPEIGSQVASLTYPDGTDAEPRRHRAQFPGQHRGHPMSTTDTESSCSTLIFAIRRRRCARFTGPAGLPVNPCAAMAARRARAADSLLTPTDSRY